MLLDNKSTCNHWQNLKSFAIASPSDVGIHNTLKQQKKLYFIDFEYSGIDDFSKLAADWILQPECCFNQDQERIFVNLLLEKTNGLIDDSWSRES